MNSPLLAPLEPPFVAGFLGWAAVLAPWPDFFSVDAEGTGTFSPQSGQSNFVPAFSSAVLSFVSQFGQEN
jgi:hypothetical protein